jgi:hypothetical protein
MPVTLTNKEKRSCFAAAAADSHFADVVLGRCGIVTTALCGATYYRGFFVTINDKLGSKCHSGQGPFDMQACIDHFPGNLTDGSYDEGEPAMALALPFTHI